MGKIDTIRLATSGAAPDILDVLAAGEPPAFATDSRERVVFWNRGASALLGQRSEEAVGRHCYEVLGGCDVFGNRFCYANCPLAAMARSGETPRAFELRVAGKGEDAEPQTVQVTVLRLPGPRPDLFTLVHILQGIDEGARLTRTLAHFSRGSWPAAPPRGTATAASMSVVPPDGGTARALTPREHEVLALVATGQSNKDIAGKLALSLATVRNHIHNTLEKLDVHSKLAAVSVAYRNGWLDPGDARGRSLRFP